ncbi:MAG: hypothetical protein QXD61_09215 [Candidatus Caldarchaeum sp.]
MEPKPLVKRTNTIPQEWGEKTTLSSLVGKTITVYDRVKVGGDNSNLYAYAARFEGVKTWFFSSSEIIARYADQIPFVARVVQRQSARNKGRRYLDFDAP